MKSDIINSLLKKLTGLKNAIIVYQKPLINVSKSSLVSQIQLIILHSIRQTRAGYRLNHSHNHNVKISDFRLYQSKLNSFQHHRLQHSFCSKTRIFLKRNLYIKFVNHQISRNPLSDKQILQTSIQKRLSCLTKSIKMKTNLVARVTILISKSQSFTISIDELDYY